MPDVISFARGAPSLDIVDVEGLKAAANARLRPRPRRHDRLRHRRGLRAAARVDRRQARRRRVAGDRHQRLDAGRRVLFETLVKPGDPVVVERPTYDHVAEPPRPRRRRADGQPRDRRHRRRRAGDAAPRRRRPPTLATSSPTSRTRPATRSARQAPALLRLAASSLRDLETTPTSTSASARAAADHALAGHQRGGRLRVVVLKNRLPGIRVATSSPAERIAEIQRLATNTYISPTWWRSRSSTSSAPTATSTARSPRQGRAWPPAWSA